MRTILITGASSGFGLEMTKEFLENGYHVIATMRNLAARKAIFDQFNSSSKGKVTLFELDITKPSDIESVYQLIGNEFDSKLDVLINNAGFGAFGALEDTSEEQIRYQMEVNFFGPTLLTKKLLPYIRNAKGKVINVSSVMGRFSSSLGGVYSASKYALEGLTEGLRYELDSHGVQVTTIQPGGHRTGFLDSVQWGELSHDEKSPYQKQTEGLKNFMVKMSSRKKAPRATKISKKALALVEGRTMPRRVLIGKDAKLVGFLQAILPDSVYYYLTQKGQQ